MNEFSRGDFSRIARETRPRPAERAPAARPLGSLHSRRIGANADETSSWRGGDSWRATHGDGRCGGRTIYPQACRKVTADLLTACGFRRQIRINWKRFCGG